MNNPTYTALSLLSRDELYRILTLAGISFPNSNPAEITKEELLLVADEADQKILETELAKINL